MNHDNIVLGDIFFMIFDRIFILICMSSKRFNVPQVTSILHILYLLTRGNLSVIQSSDSPLPKHIYDLVIGLSILVADQVKNPSTLAIFFVVILFFFVWIWTDITVLQSPKYWLLILTKYTVLIFFKYFEVPYLIRFLVLLVERHITGDSLDTFGFIFEVNQFIVSVCENFCFKEFVKNLLMFGSSLI